MKIYLRLKRNISILVDDGNWSLHTGDMIVLEKIGIRTIEKQERFKSTQYISQDSYLLRGFEYENFKNVKEAFDGNPEYHMVWKDCFSVDTLIRVTNDGPNYETSNSVTYSEMLDNNKFNHRFFGKFTMEDVFEDVSIKYNREEKLKNILDEL
jgi:hypothetical protein